MRVVVPVRDQLLVTRRFVECILGQTELSLIHVLDNGSGKVTRRWLEGAPVLLENAQDMTIYEMWNRGFWAAKVNAAGRPFRVLISNNDVVLPPHALAQLAAALDADPSRMAAYPDYDAPWSADEMAVNAAPECTHTHGVWGQRGMSGACFMLAGERVTWRPLVQDLSYEWWRGDDHLAELIEDAGGEQACVVGLPIQHTPETSARHYPELAAAKQRDHARWRTRRGAETRRAPRGVRPAPRPTRRLR